MLLIDRLNAKNYRISKSSCACFLFLIEYCLYGNCEPMLIHAETIEKGINGK